MKAFSTLVGILLIVFEREIGFLYPFILHSRKLIGIYITVLWMLETCRKLPSLSQRNEFHFLKNAAKDRPKRKNMQTVAAGLDQGTYFYLFLLIF
jgi:hypothetical protein